MTSSWKDVSLDGLGKIMCGWIDSDGTVAIGIDVVPPHREDAPNTGKLYGRFEGWGTTGSALNQDHKKTAGLYWEDGLMVGIGGRASNDSPGSHVAGGIKVRTAFGSGSKANVVSTRFARSTRELDTASSDTKNRPRQCGRVIAVNKAASPKVIWVSCQDSSSSPADQYGIARSIDGGGSFSAWHINDRNYTGLQWLSTDPHTLYSSANDYGSMPGGIFKFSSADTGSASPVQLDGAATNNGTDWNDLFVCQLSGVTHIFACRGNQSQTGTNQAAGVWHYRSDTGAWRNITPSQVVVTTAASQQKSQTYTNFKTITGAVVAGKVNLIVGTWATKYGEFGSSGASMTPPYGRFTLSNGSTSPYVATHLRLLDAVATSTWDVISTSANVGSLTAPCVIWGTGTWGSSSGEQWVEDYIGETFGENSRLGGDNYQCLQLMADPTGSFVMSFDKAGSWRCDDPWATTPHWQPFVSGLSAIDALGVICDPSDPRRWALCDIDRSYACWADAGDGQPATLGPDPLNASPQAFNLVRTTIDNSALVCVAADTSGTYNGYGHVYELPNWWLATATTAYRWTPGTGYVIGACKFTDSGGNLVRLACGPAGPGGEAKVRRISGTKTSVQLLDKANWSDCSGVSGLSFSNNQPCYFVWNDGSDKVALLVPGSGIYRSTDAGASWTQVLAFSVSTDWYGHMSQGPDGTTIYFTQGDGPWLYRWQNWQTSTPPSSGSGNAWKIFSASTSKASACVALNNGDIAVILLYSDGTPCQIHYYTLATTTWAQIQDQRAQGYIILPHRIAGGVDGTGKIYLYVTGDATAGMRYTPDTSGASYSGAGAIAGAGAFVGGVPKQGFRAQGNTIIGTPSIGATGKIGLQAAGSMAYGFSLSADAVVGATTYAASASIQGSSLFQATAVPASSGAVHGAEGSTAIEWGYDVRTWPPAPITTGGRRRRRF